MVVKERFIGAMIGAVVIALSVSGCDPEIPEREPGAMESLEVIFNPETGVIPLPNDVAMEEGFLPRLEGAGEASAQGEFLDYLSHLRGWLSSTAIEIPFSGALDEDSLEDAVSLYQVLADEVREAEIGELIYEEQEDGTSIVRVVPADPLVHGRQYAVVVTKEVKGAKGEAVIEPLPIFFAASREPLVDDEGRATIGVLADDQEQAKTLEGLRLMLAPIFEALEAAETARDEVAVAFRWTVSPDVAAAFDAEAGRVPLPNTLALDEDGTFPAAGTCFAGQRSGNGYFDDYLANLSGWPDITPITLPLTGPIDEGSLTAESVQLWRLASDQWQRVEDLELIYNTQEVDSCTGEVEEAYYVELRPAEAMGVREQYFAFATRELKGAGGEALIPEAPIYMGMQPYPVIDEDGASLVDPLSDEQAQGIAGIQALLKPILEVIEEEVGLGYGELASVWSWYTWDDTLVVFDPTAGEIPFPNAFLVGDGGQVEIPIPGDADPMTRGILETLNQRVGFSTTAPGWIPLDGEVDPETVGYESVAMAAEEGLGTKLMTEEDFEIRYEREWGHIVVEPKKPLRANQRYAGIITKDMIGANGRPVQPSPVFVFLRSPYPLWDEEEGSLVYALDDETAEQLEAARKEYELLFILAQLIDREYFERERVVSAWAFVTEDPVEAMQGLRAQARGYLEQRAQPWVWRACDVDESCGDGEEGLVVFSDGVYADPDRPGVEVDVSNLWAAHLAGEFENIELLESGQGLEDGERVGFSVYLPKAEEVGGGCSAPFDVVIAQHGLGADRWQVGLGLANELAAAPHCLATVAMDFPFHGGRSIGAESLHPQGRPANSGEGFLTADLLAANANFTQAILDLFVLTRLVQGDELGRLFEGFNTDGPLFSERIGFVGVSLGGILGVPFVTLEAAIDTAVINGAGGRLTWILEGDEEGPSTIGGPILEALSRMGMEPGEFEFIRTMTLVQWVADWIDPFAYASTAISGERPNLEVQSDGTPGLVVGSQCEESDDCGESWRCEAVAFEGEQQERCVEYLPPVQFLVQMIKGDRTIVNRSTIALAGALGVELDETTYDDVPHSFMTIRDGADANFAAGLCAREQVAQWLGSGLQQGVAEVGEEFSPAVCLE